MIQALVDELPIGRLVEWAIHNPEASSVLGIVLFVAVAYLRTVKPREAMYWSRVKTAVIPLVENGLARISRGRVRPLTRDVTDHGDYVTTAQASVFSVVVALFRAGYRWNPLSTVKFVRDGEDQKYRRWARIQLAHREGYGKQHHVYVFLTHEGVDVYGHYEDSVTDPDGHVDGGRKRGDPYATVEDALANARIDSVDRKK